MLNLSKSTKSPSYTSTILITGGTVGLGLHLTKILARQCPDSLILICSRTHTANAADAVNRSLNQKNVQYLPLDLGSLTAVREFADKYNAAGFPKISLLFLNAGLQFPGAFKYSTDGIESTFAINHLGHALLFYLLIPHLRDNARITITASGTHDPAQKTGMPDAKYNSAQELAYPDEKSKKDNNGRQRYSTSKLCNVLWTYALARHAEEAGRSWKINSFDPGLMPGTGLARDASYLVQFLWNHVLPHAIPLLKIMTRTDNISKPEQSAANLDWVGTSQETAEWTGKYAELRRLRESSVDSRNEEKQEDLYRWTLDKLAGSDPDVKQRWLELK